jgi:hypothetical protein
MKTYNVKTPLEHDGEHFEPGDEVALADKHADPLLAVSAIEDPAEAVAEKPARAPKKVAKK